MNTSEGHITVPSAPVSEENNDNVYGNPYPQLQQPQQPQQAYAQPQPVVYAQQRFTPPNPPQPNPQPFIQREHIIVRVPVERNHRPPPEVRPVYDSSISLYFAACVSIFFPIFGLIYITIYLCCIQGRGQRSPREKSAFNLLCAVTFVTIFFWFLIGIFS